MEARGGAKPPIFLKLAPDLERSEIDDVAGVAIGRGLDGLIVSNTTSAGHL
jgi:dihydroorotate dehydrogenase